MQKNNYFVIEKGHMRDLCQNNILFDRERRKENYA